MARASKADASSIKKNLDMVEKLWQKVKKIAQERQTRLNTCMEHCRKYYGAQDKFLPWLSKAEDIVGRMQSFRNDVNRHASEYDTNYSGGDTFQSACDVDREIVREEISIMKERWENLNAFIAERAQAIADILSKP